MWGVTKDRKDWLRPCHSLLRPNHSGIAPHQDGKVQKALGWVLWGLACKPAVADLAVPRPLPLALAG